MTDFAIRIDALIEGSRVVARTQPPTDVTYVAVPDVITVTDGRNGVPEVRFDPDWEASVPATELGQAVTAALAAHYRRPAPPAAEPPPWQPRVPIGDLTHALVRLGRALDAAQADLSRALSRLSHPGMVVEGERGHLRAHVEDGRVTSLEIEPSWAKGKTAAVLAMSIGDLLLDAAETAPSAVPTDPLAQNPTEAYDYLREIL